MCQRPRAGLQFHYSQHSKYYSIYNLILFSILFNFYIHYDVEYWFKIVVIFILREYLMLFRVVLNVLSSQISI